MIGNLLSASKAYAEFYKDAREQKLSHAYIIIGDDALARNEYRRLMASTVLCPHLGCGECDTCNKIYNDSHLGVEVYNLDGKMNVKEAERLIEEAQVGRVVASYTLSTMQINFRPKYKTSF